MNKPQSKGLVELHDAKREKREAELKQLAYAVGTINHALNK